MTINRALMTEDAAKIELAPGTAVLNQEEFLTTLHDKTVKLDIQMFKDLAGPDAAPLLDRKGMTAYNNHG